MKRTILSITAVIAVVIIGAGIWWWQSQDTQPQQSEPAITSAETLEVIGEISTEMNREEDDNIKIAA